MDKNKWKNKKYQQRNIRPQEETNGNFRIQKQYK